MVVQAVQANSLVAYTYTVDLYGIRWTLRRAQVTIHKNPNRRVIITIFSIRRDHVILLP